MIKHKLLSILILVTNIAVGGAQQTLVNPYIDFELSLQSMFQRMIKAPDDDLKQQINDSIKTKFSSFIKKPESFTHTFDSLTAIGSVMPDDEKFKIYSWNLPYYDGTHDFFGFIQFQPNDDEPPKLIELQHQTKKHTDFENTVFTPSNWYGALYYEIIDKKYRGETYYTVLAYDPHDIFTKKKCIDILNIDENGMVTFGSPVFQINNKTQHRVVFEYSARVGMMLRYIDNMDMIVYDHLSPSSPAYEGRFQYYGPDFSYDGFSFDKGYWIHKEDINIEY